MRNRNGCVLMPDDSVHIVIRNRKDVLAVPGYLDSVTHICQSKQSVNLNSSH
jgi:hypothetical protein